MGISSAQMPLRTEAPIFLRLGFSWAGRIVLVAVIQAVGNQSHRQNDARQHGAQEQLRHGHIGDAGVHDQHQWTAE